MCLRDVTTTSGGGGGAGSGCGYKLPLDETESSSGRPPNEIRLAEGPVTLAATRIVLHAKDGRTWTDTPHGASAGFGRAFYFVRIPSDAWIDDVSAYDAKGRKVGEKTPDQAGESFMVHPPPMHT